MNQSHGEQIIGGKISPNPLTCPNPPTLIKPKPTYLLFRFNFTHKCSQLNMIFSKLTSIFLEARSVYYFVPKKKKKVCVEFKLVK